MDPCLGFYAAAPEQSPACVETSPPAAHAIARDPVLSLPLYRSKSIVPVALDSKGQTELQVSAIVPEPGSRAPSSDDVSSSDPPPPILTVDAFLKNSLAKPPPKRKKYGKRKRSVIDLDGAEVYDPRSGDNSELPKAPRRRPHRRLNIVHSSQSAPGSSTSPVPASKALLKKRRLLTERILEAAILTNADLTSKHSYHQQDAYYHTPFRVPLQFEAIHAPPNKTRPLNLVDPKKVKLFERASFTTRLKNLPPSSPNPVPSTVLIGSKARTLSRTLSCLPTHYVPMDTEKPVKKVKLSTKRHDVAGRIPRIPPLTFVPLKTQKTAA